VWTTLPTAALAATRRPPDVALRPAEPADVPAELIAAARPLDGHGFPSGRADGGLVVPRYGMFFGRE